MQQVSNSNKDTGKDSKMASLLKRVVPVLVLTVLSPGCVVVGGYSSGRGWFLWPGSLLIFVVLAVLILLLRRRT